jgi:hypothetical protein
MPHQWLGQSRPLRSPPSIVFVIFLPLVADHGVCSVAMKNFLFLFFIFIFL